MILLQTVKSKKKAKMNNPSIKKTTTTTLSSGLIKPFTNSLLTLSCSLTLLLPLLSLFFLILTSGPFPQTEARSEYDWLTYDAFDDLDDRMNAVNAQNCRSKSASELRLPADSLVQVPKFNRLLSYIVYPNRTKLLHAHNMALNRAFFYSYIFQKLNKSEEFPMQPGLLYYYFSAAADISANGNNINGSGVFFDYNLTYATWFKTLQFNETIDFFGPRAYRFDDYNEPTNWIREPTNHTINSEDYGAGPQGAYNTSALKTNQWYFLYLPDKAENQGKDSVTKYPYNIGIKYSYQTGKFASDVFLAYKIHGPPSPGQKETSHLPVTFTEPYFDCGRLNRWIISAVAPVVDYLPRYTDWFHLRRNTYAGVSVMDMEFLSVDFNPCPYSMGYVEKNLLGNTARCKPSTICEPLPGWGFRRGGYKCMCKPGYRYPPWEYGPFMGIEIESATELEYKYGFDCIPVELRQVIPVIRGNATYGTPEVNIQNLGKRKKRKRRAVRSEGDEFLDATGVKLVDDVQDNVRKSSRAHKKVPERVLESRILNKKLRLLRLFNLKETTTSHNNAEEKKVNNERFKMTNLDAHGNNLVYDGGITTGTTSETGSNEGGNQKTARERKVIVPRTSHPYHLQKKTNKKVPFVPKYDRENILLRRKKRQAFDEKQYARMQQIMNFKNSITGKNCAKYQKEELYLPGDIGYNVDVLFSNQARTALRLSHFLSNFLQNVDKYEEYGYLRGDRLLNPELIFGEVLANTMGDLKMKGSGVFFDLNMFHDYSGDNRQLFGPFAYRFEENVDPNSPPSDTANTNYRAVDYAGYPNSYIDEPWFKNIKERWQSNTYGLTKFRQKLMIRSDINGTSLVPFLLFPMYYQAPLEDDGMWSVPYFRCGDGFDDWIITYSVPFFGLNSVGSAIEFKGVVTVDVKLNELDINQCPQDYFVPNAFKDTARCHYETTYCVYLAGKKFVKGSYKCECKVGYEYPFNDNQWYFDGQTVEEEYRKQIAGDKQSRYYNLQCRISESSHVLSSKVLMAVFLLISTTQLFSIYN